MIVHFHRGVKLFQLVRATDLDQVEAFYMTGPLQFKTVPLSEGLNLYRTPRIVVAYVEGNLATPPKGWEKAEKIPVRVDGPALAHIYAHDSVKPVWNINSTLYSMYACNDHLHGEVVDGVPVLNIVKGL